MGLEERIRQLSSLDGISSREDAVIDYMYDAFRAFSDEVEVDRIGNVICHFPGTASPARNMMVFAHMDEIGFIVRKIEEDGFIRIERMGGVSTQILPGTYVKILGQQPVMGVIGTPSHHFIKAESKFSVPPVHELYIDIGAASKSEVEDRGIRVGSMVVFADNYLNLSEQLICGKALDDRVGCAVLLELAGALAQKQPEWDVYLVAAVMEEYNIRGIMPAVRRIEPEVSIGIDITPSCDTPDMDYNDIALGKGPALTEMNFHGRGTLAGVLPDEKLLAKLVDICEMHRIPYQREVAPGVITENGFILFENEGVAVANVSIPTRYTHTPFECIHKRDVEQIVELLKRFVLESTKEDIYGKERR